LFVYFFSVCEYCAIQQLCNYLLHRSCFAVASLQCPVIDFDRHIIKNAASPEDKQKTAGNSRNNRVPGLFIIDILLSLSSLSSFFLYFLFNVHTRLLQTPLCQYLHQLLGIGALFCQTICKLYGFGNPVDLYFLPSDCFSDGGNFNAESLLFNCCC